MGWLSGYQYRKKVTISGSSGAGENYQVKLSIGSSSGGDFHLEGHCVDFPNDIRFTKDDGLTLLNYWIEDPSQDPITVWIKIDDDLDDNVDIYCYYGSSLANSVSDGKNTFMFFDDGEGDKNGVPKASLTIGSSVGFSGRCARVVVADNGDLLMIFRLREDGSYPSGHEGQVWFSKSTDNGETWSTPVKLSNDTYDAINAEFVKYPNGDIEIFYERYDSGSGTFHTPNMVSRSTDNGETWSEFTSAVSPLDDPPRVMWQEVIVGNDVYLAAYDPPILFKSSDNGSSWSQVSYITDGATDTWYEPGLVYLGDGEFVCVLRDANKECTLQRRSTDWGQTWTTDGYIKSDGSVNPDKDAGTNVVLHQCKMWNKDKNGNNLGYVYMKAALYPGSYPRDEYGYISTDNCSSWVSRNLLREDVGEAGIVFENNSFAKHFSAGNPITNDDLDICEEYLLSENGWTVIGGTYKYDNSKKCTGIMSLYGNSPSDTAYQDFTNPSSDGSAILEFDIYDNGGTYGSVYFSDQNDNDIIVFGYYSGHSTTYYCIEYGSGYISLTDVPTRSVGWHHFKMEVKPDGSAEFTVDGVKSSVTAPAGELDNAERVHIRDYDNSETWWDRIRVRKYTSPEPTFGGAQDEEGPVFTCGDTLANLSRNWWTIHGSSSDVLKSSSASTVHKEIFPACLETLSCSDVPSSILSLISRSQDLLGLIDSNIALVTILLNAIDSIDVSDGCTLSLSFSLSCLDVLHAIDSASYPLPNVVSCLDSLGTQDSISSFLSMLCQSKDNIGGADGETSQLSVERALLDILAFQDTSSYLAGIIASASDILNVQDLNSVRLTFSCSSIDIVKNVDGGGVNVTFHLDGNDILKGADFVSGNLQVLLDSLSVFKNTDQSASSLLGFILRSATDVLDMYDLNTATLQIFSSSIDIFRTEDNSSINITLHLNSADVFKNSDSAILSLQALLSVLETLRVSDSSAASLFAEILASASDLLATSDYNGVRLEFLNSSIDVIKSEDRATPSITLHLNSSDILHGLDSVTTKLEAILCAMSEFKSTDQSSTRRQILHITPVKIFKAQQKILVFKAENI